MKNALIHSLTRSALLLAFACTCLPPAMAQVKVLKLKPARGMTRAELKYGEVPSQCAGALVLCPGYNQDGEPFLRDKAWMNFAQRNKLVPIALSFASDEADLSARTRRGYYYAKNGSGKLLLSGVRTIAGKEVPIVIFGFSGGAHFTHRFAYAFPDKVRVWGAYSFAWYDKAPNVSKPKPGIFICGLDDERLDSTRDAFLSASNAKWPACWLPVAKNGHSIDRRAADFTRSFFDAVLAMPTGKEGISEKPKKRPGEKRTATVWFPNTQLKEAWEKFPSER
jgi:pimeloyl-ACP methyl ester carboxylesterase